MTIELSIQDLQFILESLKDTKIKFEKYESYPDHEFKLQRIKDVETIISKVQSLIKEKK